MSLMFEDDRPVEARPRGGQRLSAVIAVALVAVSWSFLSSLAAETARPVQSTAWLFGPAPAAQSLP